MRWVQTFLAVAVAALLAALVLAALPRHDSPADRPSTTAAQNAPWAALVPRSTDPGGGAPAAAGSGAQFQAAPGAISVVPDPLGGDESVFKFTVEEGDVYPITPTEDPRAQALLPPFIEEGDEFWLRTKFMLPDDFPSVPGWMSLISVYGPPFEGSSPWQIGIDGDEIRWQRNGGSNYDVPWRMPVVKGRWIDVLLHQRFAADGWVEMWIDGERVTFFPPGTYNPDGHPTTDRLAMATVDSSNDDGPNSAKIMQYRQAGMFDSATVYFGALRIGESRASVDA